MQFFWILLIWQPKGSKFRYNQDNLAKCSHCAVETTVASSNLCSSKPQLLWSGWRITNDVWVQTTNMGAVYTLFTERIMCTIHGYPFAKLWQLDEIWMRQYCVCSVCVITLLSDLCACIQVKTWCCKWSHIVLQWTSLNCLMRLQSFKKNDRLVHCSV